MASSAPREPELLRSYQRYLDDKDAARFIQEVSQRYLVSTLERLVGSADPLRRRAAILALSYLGDYEQNAVLGRSLHDSDRGVRLVADAGIRELWQRQGNDQDRKHLEGLIRMNQAQRWTEVIVRATRLIEHTPWFAELWNQRAIAYFHQSSFEDSANDCHQTLELNPYHFGAAIGMAHCYLELEDPYAALECFRRALRLHPGLDGVRAQADYLERSLGKG